MQTSYANNPGVAFAGLLFDTGSKDIISRIANARQLFSVVVTTEYNSQDFTVTIDGTAYTYTSDGSATKIEIAAGLQALIDAGDHAIDATEAFTTSETDDSFYIQASGYEDSELVVTITNPANGVLTLAELVDYEQEVPFGVVVVDDQADSVDGNTGKRIGCALPRLSADVTSRRVLGVAIADASKITTATSPYGGYAAGQSVPILRKGRIWMEVEDVASVVMGGLVYVRSTATSPELLGAIRAADDGSDTDPIDSNAAQFTGQVSGDLAVVEWNLP